MFGLNANPEKFNFTTRRGKKKMATLNQVLGMPTMWSDESIAHAERMKGKGIYANPRLLSVARNPRLLSVARNPMLPSVRRNGGGKTIEARYGGKCKMTGEPYEAGESITKVDGVGWCLSKNV